MALIKRILCDVCRVEKKETNHWFRAEKTISGGITFLKWNYDDPIRNLSSDFHLCGEQCCQKKLSEFTAQ